MLLSGAIANVRAALDDSGLFQTSFGAITLAVAAGSVTIPIADATVIQPGLFVTIGSPANLEGHLITNVDVNAMLANITPALVADRAAYAPINVPAVHDDIYAIALAAAVREYSKYRPLLNRTTVNVVAGTDTYTLPADFVKVDQDSFDRVIGRTSQVLSGQRFYSLIYELADRYSTVSYGMTSGYGAGPGYGRGPDFGDPNTNPLTGYPYPTITYRFENRTPPQLIISPVPTINGTLTFFYQATHTLPAVADINTGQESTLPAEDENLVALYATHLMAQHFAAGKASVMRYDLNGEKIDNSKSPEAYTAIGKTALAEFDRTVRLVAYGTMG